MRDDTVDSSWNSLGGCLEIAGTSDAACPLMLDVSERTSEKVVNLKALALYGWAMHDGLLLRA